MFKKLNLLSIGFIIPAVISAGEMNLSEVIEKVMSSSKEIQNIQDNHKKGNAEIDEYVGYTRPNISFNTSANYVDNSAKAQGAMFGIDDLSSLMGGEPGSGPDRLAGMSYDWALQASQTLNIFRIGVTLDIAENQESILSNTRKMEEESLIQQTVVLFNEALSAQEDLKVAEQVQKVQKDLLAFAEIEKKAGRLSNLEFRKMSVGVKMANAEVNQKSAIYEEKMRHLQNLLGGESEVSLVYNESDLNSLENGLDQSLSDPYSLQVLKSSSDLVKNNARYQNSFFYPSLELIGRVNNQMLGYDDQKFEVLDRYLDPDYFNYTLGVKLSWNIFSGGTVSSKYDQLKIQSRIQEREVAIQEERIARNLQMMKMQLKSLKEYYTTSQEYTQVLEESYQKDQNDYKSGLIRLVDLTTSEKEFKEAYLGALNARTAYINLLVQYRVLAGLGIYGGSRE